MTPRIRVSDVARLTSIGRRAVQDMAAAGKIPGAAKLGGLWTFDPDKLSRWITQRERQACRSISTYAAPSIGAGSKSPDANTDQAYERLMRAKRLAGSGRGGSNSNAHR
ncbi:MAG TPA: helix-turn-helix domain-containing protein [Acetobacteraceae bacterium]|nr:helix-turn-helix domain-containing protein [Acetobacteraceae bacterium]